MSAIMSDLIESNLTPAVANATCNAAGKMLKMVELKHKYGTPQKASKEKSLLLAGA